MINEKIYKILHVLLVNLINEIQSIKKSVEEFGNVLGIILNCENNVYEIGTRCGRLGPWYSRNQFQISEEKFINKNDVPRGTIILRECAGKCSLLGHVYKRCNCKKACSCKKAKLKCNSKCHSSMNCTNKFELSENWYYCYLRMLQMQCKNFKSKYF